MHCCRYSIHVVDTDPNSASANGWLENTDLVTKYKMSDEDYEKRENSYRRVARQRRGWGVKGAREAGHSPRQACLPGQAPCGFQACALGACRESLGA